MKMPTALTLKEASAAAVMMATVEVEQNVLVRRYIVTSSDIRPTHTSKGLIPAICC